MACRKMGVEFLVAIEVFLDRRLSPARDEDELLDPRRPRLLDRILDKRLVDHRQHHLGHRLARRQKPRGHAGDREHGLSHWLRHCRGLVTATDGEECGDVPRRPQHGKPHNSAAEQQLLRLVDLGREIVGAAVIGVELAHQGAVRLLDLLRAGARTRGRGSRKLPRESSACDRRSCACVPSPGPCRRRRCARASASASARSRQSAPRVRSR